MGKKQRLFEVMRKVNPDFKPSLNEISTELSNKAKMAGTSKVLKTYAQQPFDMDAHQDALRQNKTFGEYINPDLKKELEYKGYQVGKTANGSVVLTYNDASAYVSPDGEIQFGGEATEDLFPEDFQDTVAIVKADLSSEPEPEGLTENASKSKTFTLNLWGQDEELYFVFDKYGNNGATAVQLMSPMEGPYATVSVNMPESTELPPDEFFMKAWSENQELAEQLIEKEIVIPTGKEANSGFVTARSYKLNPIYSSEGIGNVGLNEGE